MTTIPIWVVDPAGNNNPFLEVVLRVVFVAAGLSNANIYWSTDGLAWTQASYNVGSFNIFGSGFINYGNGTWLIKFASNDDVNGATFIYSTDGQTWTQKFTIPHPELGTTTYGFDSGNNRWDIGYIQSLLPTVIGHFYIDSPYPADTFTGWPPTNLVFHPGDMPLAIRQMLPSGFTGVRYTSFSLDPNFTFEYTRTTITQAIIDSGQDWPDATWENNGFVADTVHFGQIGSSN